ncbi:hypothetical protein D3C74_273410 [compost metagenome]
MLNITQIKGARGPSLPFLPTSSKLMSLFSKNEQHSILKRFFGMQEHIQIPLYPSYINASYLDILLPRTLHVSRRW